MIKKQASQAPIWGRSMGSPWLGPSCLQLSNQWGCGTYSSRGNPISTMDGLTDWPTARLGSGNSCVSESGVWAHFALRSTPKTDIEPEILSVNYVLGLLWDPRRRYQPVFQCRICFGFIVRWKQKISTWFLLLAVTHPCWWRSHSGGQDTPLVFFQVFLVMGPSKNNAIWRTLTTCSIPYEYYIIT